MKFLIQRFINLSVPRTIFFIGVILILAPIIAQAGWKWQNPTPFGNNLNDIFIQKDGTLFAVGDQGIILQSKNGGTNWDTLPSFTHFNLKAITFLNKDTGWTVGSIGTLFQTTDGGKTWKSRPTYSVKSFLDIFFLDALHGWIVTDNNSSFGGSGPGGTVLRTSDGGKSWEIIGSDLFSGAKSIQFIDSSLGWIAGLGLYKTVNGGKLWTRTTSISSVEQVQFVDSLYGWCLQAGGNIAKTIDGGVTWFSTSLGSVDLKCLYFRDRNHGWIAAQGLGGEGSVIFSTSNGGASWTSVKSHDYPTQNAIAALDNNTIFMVGIRGSIIRSSDGGGNWQRQTKDVCVFPSDGNDFTQAMFVDASYGWAIGSKWHEIVYDEYPMLFRTQNGGTTWDSLPLPGNRQNNLLSIFFVDRLHGWISYDGTFGSTGLYSTNDGGLNWSLLDATMKNNAMIFQGIDSGWAATSITFNSKKYGVWFTSDGGSHWAKKFSPVDSENVMISFPNMKVGWVCDGKRSYRTLDGGTTWDNHPIGAPYLINSISAVDSLKAWAAGGDATMMATIDGGKTWKYQSLPTLSSMNSVHFIDGMNGWAAGDYGVIVRTVDGGAHWTMQKCITGNYYTSIFFLDKNTGWATGAGNMIVATTDGGGSEPPPVGIAGTINNIEGKPIAGVGVDAIIATMNSNGVQVLTRSRKAVTDQNGMYEFQAPYSWTGYITPSKGAYTFEPDSNGFGGGNVRSNQLRWFQSRYCMVEVKGQIKVLWVATSNQGYGSGIKIETSDNVSKAYTNSSGSYTLYLPCGWSGTVKPEPSTYYTYDAPQTKTYSDIQGNDSLNFFAKVYPVPVNIESGKVELSDIKPGIFVEGNSSRIRVGVPLAGLVEVILSSMNGESVVHYSKEFSKPGYLSLSLPHTHPAIVIGSIKVNHTCIFKKRIVARF